MNTFFVHILTKTLQFKVLIVSIFISKAQKDIHLKNV